MAGINRKNLVCKDGSRQLPQGSNPCPRSFFKIMIGSFREVLFIPPKFSETFVSLVDENVYLEDVNGKSSKVKVDKIDGSLAFQEGWHDFVVDHCIHIGEVLIFKYVSRSLFLVQIFGRNACERVSFVEGNNCHLYEEDLTSADLSLKKSPLPKRRKSFEAPNYKHHSSTRDSELEVEGDLPIPSNKMREDNSVANSVKNDYGSSKLLDVMDIAGSLINKISGQATVRPGERGNSIVEQHKAAAVNKISLPKLKNCKTEPLSNHVASLCIEENLAGHEHTPLPNLETVKTEPHSNHVTSLCVEENLAGHEHTHRESLTALVATTNDSILNSFLPPNTAQEGIAGAGEQGKHNIETLEALGMKLVVPKEVIRKSSVSEEGAGYLVNNDLENEFTACTLTPIAVDSSKLAARIMCTNNVAGVQDASCHNASVPEVTCLNPKVGFIEGVTSNCKHAHENGNSSGSLSRKDISPLAGNKGCLPELLAVDTTEGNACQSAGILHDPYQEEDEMDGTFHKSQNLKVVKMEEIDTDDPFPQDPLCLSITLSPNQINWIDLPQRLLCCKGKTKKDSRLVFLQDPSRRLWPVMYHESINFVGFLSGWKDFAIANNLQQGHKCDFFDIGGGDDVFQVKIAQSLNPSSEL